jgi:hypothetical protein
MKDLVIAAIIAVTLQLTFTAAAAWLIDAERFHVSVHDQLSCRDCHGDINKNHPLTAFLFDLSGMMVIIGIVGM